MGYDSDETSAFLARKIERHLTSKNLGPTPQWRPRDLRELPPLGTALFSLRVTLLSEAVALRFDEWSAFVPLDGDLLRSGLLAAYPVRLRSPTHATNTSVQARWLSFEYRDGSLASITSPSWRTWRPSPRP